ncbi:MAG: hypothetical protein IPH62_15110 [Ignavibacteriae bacterium]|nr:hypothetical protein [Ignavibacteriota bacterium]
MRKNKTSQKTFSELNEKILNQLIQLTNQSFEQHITNVYEASKKEELLFYLQGFGNYMDQIFKNLKEDFENRLIIEQWRDDLLKLDPLITDIEQRKN